MTHNAPATNPYARGPKSQAPQVPVSGKPSGGSATVPRRPPVENVSQLSPYQRSRLPVPKPSPEKWKMSPLESAFVGYYIGISRFNAADAWKRAYCSGDMGAIVTNHAYVLLKSKKIQAAIQAAMDVRAKKLELSAERVLQEVMRVAFVDPADFFDEVTGEMKNMHEIPEDARRAIAAMEFEKNKYGSKKTVKTSDKLKALELLGRHLKLFKEELHVTITFEQMVLASMEEAKQLPAGSNVIEVNEPPEQMPDIEQLMDDAVIPEEVPDEVDEPAADEFSEVSDE